ncbi:histidyl-tRNA synthetase [Cryptosporidium felis]|nr:histidyl-tRNA synthetase [Cryptosporidium felis]
MVSEEAVSLFVGSGGVSAESIAKASTSIHSEFIIEPRLKEEANNERSGSSPGSGSGECLYSWDTLGNLLQDLGFLGPELGSNSDLKTRFEFNSSEIRALLLTKATNIGMGGKKGLYRVMTWLLEQAKDGTSIPFHIEFIGSDLQVLGRLLGKYSEMTGDEVSAAEVKSFVKGFAPTLSQLILHSEISKSLGSFGECTLALLMEAFSFPLCFLIHLGSVSTGGLADTTRSMRWLLEDSKVSREGKWQNKELGVNLTKLVCSLGSLRTSLGGFGRPIKGFISKGGNATTSTKGIENSIEEIEMMPLLEPLRSVISSLVYMEASALEFLDLLLKESESQGLLVSLHDFSAFETDPEISAVGLDTAKVFMSVSPLTANDVNYITSRVSDLKRSSSNILEVLGMDSAKQGVTKTLIFGFKELIERNMELFSLIAVVSMQKLADRNYQQYLTGIEKARKKSKKEFSLVSHESKNVHEFRKLLIGLLDKFHVQENVYLKLLSLLNGGGIYRLNSKLESILTPQNQSLRRPKIPKGTQDVAPQKMAIKNLVFEVVREVYRSHGAVEIDTPVFELKDTLFGKYGEDSKLIYDLKDQGGEQLSLRYDLTVPLARYVATTGVEHLKRYQIGKVYRRDEPQMSRGRFREFYQCDLDIVGQYESMVADSEIIKIATQVLSSFKNWIGDFCIKINHRRLLDGILEISGVPSEKFKMICSSIDKLDKESWEDVKTEMVTIKGLSESCVDIIGSIIQLKGSPDFVLESIRSNGDLISNQNVCEAVKDMETLFKYISSCSNCMDFLTFDLSLARGLDYYTGVIYEAVLISGDSTNVGSIAAGGRYDKLIGMFSQKEIPAVGFSVGIERIMSIIERKFENLGSSGPVSRHPLKGSFTDILICNVGEPLLEYRFKIASLLWDNLISCEISQTGNGKLRKQLDFASNNNIPFCIIVGEDETSRNTVQFKVVSNFESSSGRTEDTNSLEYSQQSQTSQEIHLENLIDHIQSVISEFGSSFSKFSSEFK